jgi:hypothetical protein
LRQQSAKKSQLLPASEKGGALDRAGFYEVGIRSFDCVLVVSEAADWRKHRPIA